MYIPIIGMEIHVEPTTESKMFCDCPAEHFNQEPNSHTCPVCLGLPGALPIPNQAAIDACLKLGLALNCQINQQSKFDRKNYFYPDLPKAYQISQYDLPFCYDGNFTFPSEVQPETSNQKQETSIGITRVHMEEDTGKLSHETIDGQKVSLIDYNRSGVPLIEIVTEPDLHSAAETKHFLKWLTRTIQFLGISDCDMEKGSMRLEANISVAQVSDDYKPGEEIDLPNYKVEVKNVNSFRYIEKAIEFEIERHIELLKKGETPTQETRGFSEDRSVTFSQRSKEEAQDYRYFPEPDIPPINVTDEKIEILKSSLTTTPIEAMNELTSMHNLRPDYAEIIINTPTSYQKFLQILGSLPTEMKPEDAAKVIVNQTLDLEVASPEEIISTLKKSIKTYSMTEDQILDIVQKVIVANPGQVEQYKQGKTQLLGFFVGQVMGKTKGQADPKLVNQAIMQQLG